MLSDPTFWTAAAALVFFLLLGGRIVRQARDFLDRRRENIISEMRALEMMQKVALSELEHAQKDLKEAQALTLQWLEDAKKHAHEVERSAHVLMQYRRELARQNLELHLQDMRIRLLQELSHDFLYKVSEKLQVHWEIEGGASLLEDLQKAIH